MVGWWGGGVGEMVGSLYGRSPHAGSGILDGVSEASLEGVASPESIALSSVLLRHINGLRPPGEFLPVPATVVYGGAAGRSPFGAGSPVEYPEPTYSVRHEYVLTGEDGGQGPTAVKADAMGGVSPPATREESHTGLKKLLVAMKEEIDTLRGLQSDRAALEGALKEEIRGELESRTGELDATVRNLQQELEGVKRLNGGGGGGVGGRGGGRGGDRGGGESGERGGGRSRGGEGVVNGEEATRRVTVLEGEVDRLRDELRGMKRAGVGGAAEGGGGRTAEVDEAVKRVKTLEGEYEWMRAELAAMKRPGGGVGGAGEGGGRVEFAAEAEERVLMLSDDVDLLRAEMAELKLARGYAGIASGAEEVRELLESLRERLETVQADASLYSTLASRLTDLEEQVSSNLDVDEAIMRSGLPGSARKQQARDDNSIAMAVSEQEAAAQVTALESVVEKNHAEVMLLVSGVQEALAELRSEQNAASREPRVSGGSEQEAAAQVTALESVVEKKHAEVMLLVSGVQEALAELRSEQNTASREPRVSAVEESKELQLVLKEFKEQAAHIARIEESLAAAMSSTEAQGGLTMGDGPAPAQLLLGFKEQVEKLEKSHEREVEGLRMEVKSLRSEVDRMAGEREMLLQALGRQINGDKSMLVTMVTNSSVHHHNTTVTPAAAAPAPPPAPPSEKSVEGPAQSKLSRSSSASLQAVPSVMESPMSPRARHYKNVDKVKRVVPLVFMERTVCEVLFAMARQNLDKHGVDSEVADEFRDGRLHSVKTSFSEKIRGTTSIELVVQVHRKLQFLTEPENRHNRHKANNNAVMQLSQCIFHEIQFMMDEIFCRARSTTKDKFLRMAPIRKAFNRLMENASSVPFVGYGVREPGSSEDTHKDYSIVDVINLICLCDRQMMKTFFSMRACGINVHHRMGGIGPNRLLRLQEFFYEVDKDGSGTITQDELKYHINHDPKMAALLDFPSTKPSKKQLAELFKKLDTNDDDEEGDGKAGKDGVIDFIEFATYFSAMPAMQFWAVMESTPSPSKVSKQNSSRNVTPRK